MAIGRKIRSRLGAASMSALLICGLITGPCEGQSAKPKPADFVAVYYFHGNFRCPTCFKMEQNSEKTAEECFKDELASGKVVFRSINTDDTGNEHFVRDYGLYTKSLIISLVKDGKEVKHKNLAKIWEYAWDEAKFRDYVRGEIESYLKELHE